MFCTLGFIACTSAAVYFKDFVLSYTTRLVRWYHDTQSNTVIILSKKEYEVEYMLRDKTYRIKLPMQRGPIDMPIIQDIPTKKFLTDDVLEYAGPCLDFHGQSPMTPKDFHSDHIIVIYEDETYADFKADDHLQLKGKPGSE